MLPEDAESVKQMETNFMKNIDLSEIKNFRTSQDYSILSLPELLAELTLACNDIARYRQKMVKECNDLRKEHKNLFRRDWEDLC